MKQNVRYLMGDDVIYTVNFKKVLTKRSDINDIKIKSITEKRVRVLSQ